MMKMCFDFSKKKNSEVPKDCMFKVLVVQSILLVKAHHTQSLIRDRNFNTWVYCFIKLFVKNQLYMCVFKCIYIHVYTL